MLTATEDIIDILGKKITQGDYLPGEKLPTERDLAVQYSVARGRIREALRGLAMAGLIDIKRGNGTFVRDPDDWVDSMTVRWAFSCTSASMKDLLVVRDVLEKGIYEQAYDSCNNIDLEKIKLRLERIKNTLKDTTEIYADALDSFDLEMARISRNVLFLRLFQILLILRRDKVEQILKLKGSRKQSLYLREQIYLSFKERDKKHALKVISDFFAKAKNFIREIEEQ